MQVNQNGNVQKRFFIITLISLLVMMKNLT